MKSDLALIGGGPSALLLAAHLDPALFNVTIYEQQKTVGRKFLVAGKGGFNLTHGGNMEEVLQQYHPQEFIRQALQSFTPSNLRTWLDRLGINTYVGSSGRIFPNHEIKPIEVLQAILKELESRNVTINCEEKWKGWDRSGDLIFESGLTVKPQFTVLALGGGSWKITGSNSRWLPILEEKGVTVNAFKAVNCGFTVDWAADFIDKYAGQPLKNIKVSMNKLESTGELILTDYGLEGNAIYAISYALQEALKQKDSTQFNIDLKPTLTTKSIQEKLEQSTDSISQTLIKEIKLSKVKLALLKSTISKEDYLNLTNLAQSIKALPLTVSYPRSLDEAISTIGGVSPSALTQDYQLKAIPNTYCIGEMVDWFAPTGGYLLQGCFSMGVSLAKQLNKSNTIK